MRWKNTDLPKSREILAELLLAELPLNRDTQPVSQFRGGTDEGLKSLEEFVKGTLTEYDNARNLPHLEGTSRLSAYLHFDHLGPHTIALAVQIADAPEKAKEAYLEELIVRRELAINFVARNPLYDRLEGCPDWARKTLKDHEQDEREHLYTEREFELAETHDPLWNAAQMEMVVTGRMHGYLRMYWAMKILEWTRSPAEAFDIAIRLNDRYELDGKDPNGYTGIAWAIGGKHDRPWPPARPVFGMIRYMNFNGCARKFDVNAYICRIEILAGRKVLVPGAAGS